MNQKSSMLLLAGATVFVLSMGSWVALRTGGKGGHELTVRVAAPSKPKAAANVDAKAQAEVNRGTVREETEKPVDLKSAAKHNSRGKKRIAQTRVPAQTAATQAKPAVPAKDTPPADPDARLALSFVGADSEAEQYWINAINNPAIPAEERRELIEDLNQDGLTDPENPSVEDIPLIVYRLRLIEDLADNSMDKVNAAALAEAHKDLVEMYAKLTQ